MNIRNLTALLLILFSATAQGQTLTRVVSDDMPGIEDKIEVAYTFTGKPTGMKHDDFSEFTVIEGPHQSQSTNTNLVNGKYVTTTSLRLNYVLHANHTGTIVLHGASATGEDGKIYTTTDATIKVVEGGKAQPVKHKEASDALYQLGNKIKDSRYKYIVATGPVYVAPNLSHGDSVLHSALSQDILPMMKVYTKCEALDTVYWENFPMKILQQMDSAAMAPYRDMYRGDIPRYYFAVKDTGFIYSVLQTVHSQDKQWHYMTEIMRAADWKMDREINTIRGAHDLYSALSTLGAARQATGKDVSGQKNIGITFRFDDEGDAAGFTVPLMAGGYRVSAPQKTSFAGKTQTGYTVTVTGMATSTDDELYRLAEDLLRLASEHKGYYTN
jgi:hypothetical protein